MAVLGSAKSSKFQIGASEIRIGPLERAGRLTQDDSIGLLQSASVNYTQESTDLEGGLPKATIATVITKTGLTVSASAYEYTLKNMKIMMNDASAFTDVTSAGFSLNMAAASAAATSLPTTAIPAGTYSVEKVTAAGIATYVTATVAADSTAGVSYKLLNTAGQVVHTLKVGSSFKLNNDSATTYTLNSIALTFTAGSVSSIALGTTALVTALTGIDVASSVGAQAWTDVVKTATSPAAGALTLDVQVNGAGLKKDDVLVAYPAGKPEQMTVLVLSADASGQTLNFANTPLLFALTAGDTIYKADNAGIGGNTTTNYFAMDIISKDQSTGKPVGFQLWKVAVTSGLDFSFSGDSWGTTSMAFKAMLPTADDVAASGKLAHTGTFNSKNPYGRFLSGN
jgi:hypothetical protein